MTQRMPSIVMKQALCGKWRKKGVILNKEDKLGEKFAKERISILLCASMARRK